MYAARLNDGTTPVSCLDLGDAELASGFPWGDVNCDGLVNAIDALYLLAHKAGIELQQPQGCVHVGQAIT